jgi:hypothetical protein
LGGEYTVDATTIHRVTILPMHGEELGKVLTTKYSSHNGVYGKYNMNEGMCDVVISDIILGQFGFPPNRSLVNSSKTI